MFDEMNLPPYSDKVKYYANFIIVRSLIASLTSEQRKTFDSNLELTLRLLEQDSNMDPELIKEIKGAVMFMS